MPVEQNVIDLFGTFSASFVIKAFLVLFLIFYSVFALILYRQEQLMAQKLPTTAVPVLRFIAIVHIGVSLALLFIVIGVF